MKLIVNLGKWDELKQSRAFAVLVRFILNGLVMVDCVFLKLRPRFPRLYDAGVEYREEPEGGPEEFASIPVVYKRKWGDCDDLAPWLCAERRVRDGLRAKIRVSWKRSKRTGRKVFHVTVRLPNGKIEDPSLRLGMGR